MEPEKKQYKSVRFEEAVKEGFYVRATELARQRGVTVIEVPQYLCEAEKYFYDNVVNKGAGSAV